VITATASWWRITLKQAPLLVVRVGPVRDEATVVTSAVTTNMRESCCWRITSHCCGGMSSQVAGIALGMIHDTGLISVRAYNFVFPANVLGPGVRTATAKTFHLCALVGLLAGCILTVAIKSTLSNARKGCGVSSGLGSGGKELFAASLINLNDVKDVADLVFSLD
jgi:hypothetical protein